MVPDRALSEFFEEAAKKNPSKAKAIGNYVTNDLLRELSEAGQSLAMCKVSPEHLLSLVEAVDKGTITKQIAKDVFVEMFQSGELAGKIIDRKGLKPDFDDEQVKVWCQEAINENPKPVDDFRSGNDKALNALLGQVMKKSRGKANPQSVNQVLRELLS